MGDKVQIFAAVNSVDPVGSPMISVSAVQGEASLTLDPIPLNHPLFAGLRLYYKFIELDPGLTGGWTLTPADSTGTGPPIFTNAIAEPEFLPFVNNVAVHGMPFGASVFWALPDLDSFDVDAISVRLIETATGYHVFESNILPTDTTSYQPPPGVLQAGIDYVYCIILGDLIDPQGFNAENVSFTFSEPFRYAATGDFNHDGTVNAADYIVWRKGLGTTYDQNDYGVWRAHFGASLGPGSGAALHSAAPLSAAVPEPATHALATLMLLGLFGRARRDRNTRT